MVEYALVVSLFTVTLVPVIGWLTTAAGDYLLATGVSIGAPPTTGSASSTGAGSPPSTGVAPPPNWWTSTPVLGPELIVNGGFEAPVVTCPNGCWTPVRLPPPWRTTFGVAGPNSTEMWHGSPYGLSPYAGDQYIELNTWGPTTHVYTADVTPGVTYRWSFAHRESYEERAELAIDGRVVATIEGQPVWTVHEGVVVAQSSTMTLQFRPTSWVNGDAGNAIDEVSLRSYG